MTTDMEFCQKHFDAAYSKAEKYYGQTLNRAKLILKSQVSRAGYCVCGVGSAIKLSVDGKPGKYHLVRPTIMISTYWLKHKGRREAIQTIYHEVAHAVVAELFGRVKSHGPEWKRVMRVVFDLKADRCIQHNARTLTDKIKRRSKRRAATSSVITGGTKKTIKSTESRTVEQIQADKDRMAKVRAARKKKTFGLKLKDSLKKLLGKLSGK